jgi:uncharacterized protein (TIRG00374 family)
LGPVILLVVLWRLPNPGEVLELASRSSLPLLAASVALNFVAIHTKVVRWQVLLRGRGIHYETKDAWLAFASAMYLGMVTPGRVGDVLRIQYLRHDKNAPYAEGLASVVMDRLCDLYALVGFVAIAIAHYSRVVVGELRIISWAVVAATALGPLVLLVPGIAEKLGGAIYRRVRSDPDARDLDVFLGALRAQVGRALLVTLPITVAAFLVGFAQGWLVARAMGMDIAFFDIMCLTAVASLLSLLPISISGVGVREALFAVIFPSLGFTVAQGVSYGILVFFTVYVAGAAIGFVIWQIRPPPTGALPDAPA